MGRRLITSASEAASGGGGYTLCNDLCVTSVKADTFTNSTNGCKLAQFELIDCCDDFLHSDCNMSFDYLDIATKYDLICFNISFPVSSSGCNVICANLNFNNCKLCYGCSSSCPYYTGCYHCSGGYCVSCTRDMFGYNCAMTFCHATVIGEIYPLKGQSGMQSSPAGMGYCGVGYDIHLKGEPGYYFRSMGLNRGFVFCGCCNIGWSTLTGLSIGHNCVRNAVPGKYFFYGRLCQGLD